MVGERGLAALRTGITGQPQGRGVAQALQDIELRFQAAVLGDDEPDLMPQGNIVDAGHVVRR